jgi:hypothetical protein
MATVMFIDHLPYYTESSYVFTELFHNDKEDRIKEIYTYHPNGGTCAWVVFHEAEDAQHAVSHYDREHFGPIGQRIVTSLLRRFDPSPRDEYPYRFRPQPRAPDPVMHRQDHELPGDPHWPQPRPAARFRIRGVRYARRS